MAYFRGTALSLISLFILHCGANCSDEATADLPKKAIERSQITLPGSPPFLLRASVLEATNPSNAKYKAEIEEYWVAPDKWRRTVKTADFSQTLVVNGEKRSMRISGDYYPNWLQTIVAALFEPGERLQGVDLKRSSDNPMLGGTVVCRRFMYLAGVAPVSNKVFSTYCFEGGLLESISVPGYDASYKNYKRFAGKRVARTIGEYIEPGEELEATVSELRNLTSPDEARLDVEDGNARLETVKTDETALRILALTAPDVVWPKTYSGSNKGTLSLYVCLDRSGHVREIYELNSSNPGLSDIAREQVMKWQFKPFIKDGAPVQLESILTFAFP